MNSNQVSPLHSWHWGFLSWTATYWPPTNNRDNQPEQAIKRRPFLSASSSPIFQDSRSEETPWSTNCPETRSVSGSWRFTKFHFTDCAIQSVSSSILGKFRRRRRQSWASLSHLGAILPIVGLKWTVGQLVRTGEEHTLPAGEERKLVLVEEGSTCCGRLSPRPARH